MKLTISKEQLIRALSTVQNVASQRSTLPILSHILLRAEPSKLHLTASDLDVTIVCELDAQVATAGAVALPVKKLVGIVKEFPAPEIELAIDKNNVCTIQSLSAQYKINGMPADDFPKTDEPMDGAKISKIDQDVFRRLIRQTSFAISTDESRFVLNGMLLKSEQGNLLAVATDGRRLALASHETGDINAFECIIPSKAINELSRMLGTAGTVQIQIGTNKADLKLTDAEPGKLNSVRLITKLVEGNYPNYRQVIPAEPKEKIVMAREQFLSALRRAEIMTSEKANSVKLSFAKNNLEITANTPDVGSAQENIPLTFKGEPLDIAFNPLYVMDGLKVLDQDEITLNLIDSLAPGVISVPCFTYVIMPMRLSQ